MNQGKEHRNTPRLGLINYVNSLPTVLPLIDKIVKIDAEINLGNPGELNALYAANKLDCGAMSAFAFLKQKNLDLMPGLSISSFGAVGSVLFFSEKPIDHSVPAKIAVPRASATSVNALLLLLGQQSKKAPSLISVDEPKLEDNNIDGALVIGDRALLVDESWSKKYHRYDLGQWWYDTFALPMVFAVFAAQKGEISLLEQLGSGLINATKVGLNEHFGHVLDEAQARTGLSRDRLKHYFQFELDFGWTDKHRQALDKYEFLCRQNGILVAEDEKVLA